MEELELNDDAQSIDNLLTFLEKTFNGGSDFNEPVTRCLQRLTDAKWANSDILLVSDGELRQPAHEVVTIAHTARSPSACKSRLICVLWTMHPLNVLGVLTARPPCVDYTPPALLI